MDSYWVKTTPEERGKLAEEKFFEAWAETKNIPSWIVSVSRPTDYEDLKQKTDAVIVCTAGPTLKIQIKSYWIDEPLRIQLMQYGVIPLGISRNDTVQKIRKKTRIAIKDYLDFLKNHAPIKRSVARKKKRRDSPRLFYKKGRLLK
ncbi:MAG: hypothetical protein ACOYMZ_02315 [Minisyncoccia bacterium]